MNQDKCWDYYQTEGIESFDQSYPRLRYLAKLLNTLVERPPVEHLRVLNVGVGNGIFEEFCIQAGHEVWCIDPSERAIRRLEQKISVQGIVGNIEDAAFLKDSFSIINVSEVLEHLQDDILQRAIENVYRMLVGGGFLVGTVPYQEKLLDNIIVCPHCGQTFHRWGHHQSFTPQRLKGLLDRQFTTVKVWVRPFVAWKKLNWKGKALGGLQLLLSFMGVHGKNENIVFYAKKA